MIYRAIFLALILFSVLLVSPISAGEIVTIEGTRYENVEVVTLVPTGIQYKTENGDLIVAPWSGLSDFQKSMVTNQMSKELYNVKVGAIWVEGDVLQRRKEGIVVRIDLNSDDEKKPEYIEGAAVAKGLVLLTDHPLQTDLNEGDPIKLSAYETGEYEYDLGIAKKMVVQCSYNPPVWAAEREWTNVSGQKMTAKLIAIKDGKGLFRRDGKQFVVSLDQLIAEDQKIAAEFKEKIKDIPLY